MRADSRSFFIKNVFLGAVNMERKKKKISSQWTGILIYLMIGACAGILILRYIEKLSEQGLTAGMHVLLFFLLMASLYAAMLIQIVIHEGGHLIFGLATGYTFSSFRIYNWMLLREGGSLHLRRLSLAGTGGQCLMGPPDLKEGRMPVLLYNFGGAIMNLAAAAASLALSFLFPSDSFFNFFLLELTLIGVSFALINGLPMHIGPVSNDGANALSLMKNREAVPAFWLQLKVVEEIAGGGRLRDMPEEWFILPDDEAMKNGLMASVGVLCCSRLMDQHRFEEADALMDRLLSIESGIAPLHRSLMICDRIFLELIGQCRSEVLEGMRAKDQQKLMKAMKNYPSVLRTEFAAALLEKKDIESAAEIEKKFEKCARSYPYPSEIQGERELMQTVRDAWETHNKTESLPGRKEEET